MDSLRRLISTDVKSAHDAISLETDWHYRSLGDFGYGSLCNQGVSVAAQLVLVAQPFLQNCHLVDRE